MRNTLILASVFVMVAGIWLGVMENLLRHEGYASRSMIAAFIALQGSATLLFILLKANLLFRKLIMFGAVAILVLGASAVLRVLSAQHFEGFVVLIGSALVVQGSLTLASLPRMRFY